MNFSSVSFEIHSLAWPNANKDIVNAQKKVFDHFNIPLIQHFKQIQHDIWLQETFDKCESDVVIFFDIDCVPLQGNSVQHVIEVAHLFGSFCGLAQVSNHIGTRSHIYAAPSMLAISKKINIALADALQSHPNLRITYRSDAAEELTWQAEEAGIKYVALTPLSWEDVPESRLAPWRMASSFYYGIGTIFEGGFFHLYQSRYGKHVELFMRVTGSIISGTPPASMKNSSSAIKLIGEPHFQPYLLPESRMESHNAKKDRRALKARIRLHLHKMFSPLLGRLLFRLGGWPFGV